MNDEKMTRQQAQDEIRALKRIFPYVSLFEEEDLKKGGELPDAVVDGKPVSYVSRASVMKLVEAVQAFVL